VPADRHGSKKLVHSRSSLSHAIEEKEGDNVKNKEGGTKRKTWPGCSRKWEREEKTPISKTHFPLYFLEEGGKKEGHITSMSFCRKEIKEGGKAILPFILTAKGNRRCPSAKS